MSDQELLQQCKDEVALQDGYTSWAHLVQQSYRHATNRFHDAYDRAAALAIQKAREEAAPKWISVKDSLPKKPGVKSYEHVPCNVYVPQWGVMMLMWNCEHGCWDDESGDDVSSYNSRVTHWMPAPEKPKQNDPSGPYAMGPGH